MTEKLKLFSTEIFLERPFPLPNGIQVSQMSVLLPIKAISYVLPREKGNPHAGYEVHFSKNYFIGEQFQVKSINPVFLFSEKIELIK
jgi:hypothetical protein